MQLFLFAFMIYVLSLAFSAFTGVVRFFVDIRKWKSREEKIHISKKEFEHDLETLPDVDTDIEYGKGVEDNAGNDR